MRGLAQAWNRFWFSPLDPLPVALFRIAMGGVLVAEYLMIAPSWERFYAADGMLALTDETVRHWPQDPWTLFYWTQNLVPVRLYWGIGLAAALAFTAGYRTRLATVVLFVLHVSMVHRNPWAVNGEDLVARMALWYGCFASLGETASIDAWLRKRRPGPPGRRRPEVWPIRLLQINVALIYVFSQPLKITGDPAWLAGDALYYTMVNATWSRWPWPELFYGRVVSSLATWGSLLIECSFPILVWIPRVRLYAVLGLGTLHVWIAIVLQNVTLFTLAMPATFLVFLTSDDLRRLGDLIRLGRRRQARPA